MAISTHIAYCMTCDGADCERCSGRCTATYPSAGYFTAENASKLKPGYNGLRKTAKQFGWKLTHRGDFCPDCVKAAARNGKAPAKAGSAKKK